MIRRYDFLNIFVLIMIISIVRFDEANSSRGEFLQHKPLLLTVEQLTKLAQKSEPAHFKQILKQIAIPRVAGSPGATQVQETITKTMEQLGWHVEVDTFQDTVPIMGPLTFNNVIARLNRNAERYLTLACHYDSKYFPSGTFVGATDSAVPCAMMINLAQTMKAQFQSVKDKTDLSLMLIFFDGEEAFKQWGPTDSIFGSRHLANKWENLPSQVGGNYLDRLDMLVLLDLIGTTSTSFISYFNNTSLWYNVMREAETELASKKLLMNYENKRYFTTKPKERNVEDDHIPFMKRGVPILHLISSPFPNVWHTEADNLKAIDLPTCENLNKIMRIFTSRYLHLKIE